MSDAPRPTARCAYCGDLREVPSYIKGRDGEGTTTFIPACGACIKRAEVGAHDERVMSALRDLRERNRKRYDAQRV